MGTKKLQFRLCKWGDDHRHRYQEKRTLTEQISKN
jgi:hypothetical protein